MTILLSAVVALLASQPALAQQRENKPFNTVNGRTSNAAPRVITVNAPGGGASGNGTGAAKAPAVTGAMIAGAPSEGGRAFAGTQVPRAVMGRGAHRSGKAIMGKKGRKADTGANAEEAPPNYSKPGALIRTTGQEPKYAPAPDKIFTNTVDAGEIVFNDRKGIDVGKAPTLHEGPKDKLPPPNPGYGIPASGGGASKNSGPVTVIAGGSGGGSGGSGGNDNNGSGNNGKGKPGDDEDGHGGDRAKDQAFNDSY
jgi:hypothetical protein